MGRLNGEIRDCEKVFRGLKKFDTPLIDGMKTYYNFTKKHGSLKGKTPAEEAIDSECEFAQAKFRIKFRSL